jgi:hypothetical protein
MLGHPPIVSAATGIAISEYHLASQFRDRIAVLSNPKVSTTDPIEFASGQR